MKNRLKQEHCDVYCAFLTHPGNTEVHLRGADNFLLNFYSICIQGKAERTGKRLRDLINQGVEKTKQCPMKSQEAVGQNENKQMPFEHI